MKNDIKKLELMIKNNNSYEEIIEQCERIDDDIEKIIEGVL